MTIFEDMIGRQVRHVARFWFISEGAKEIDVHAPRFLYVGHDDTIHYDIVVVYRPALDEPFECALLEIIVSECRARVADVKRTEKKGRFPRKENPQE